MFCQFFSGFVLFGLSRLWGTVGPILPATDIFGDGGIFITFMRQVPYAPRIFQRNPQQNRILVIDQPRSGSYDTWLTHPAPYSTRFSPTAIDVTAEINILKSDFFIIIL
jgi:hypothetical protein